MAHESSKAGLMTTSSTGNERNLWCMARSSVYDFVVDIESYCGVSDSESMKSRVHKMRRIIDKMFRRHD